MLSPALIFHVYMKTLIAVLCLAATAFAQNQPADLVLKNANIYTVDEHKPLAQAVAVKRDKIVFVGSDAEAQPWFGPDTRVLDLKGATVVPCVTDAHYHFLGVGARELTFNLEGTKSLDELLARVKERVVAAKPGEWIVGRGWIETFWNPPVFPTRSDLDKVSPNNPVILGRADGHGAVVNSAALKIAGIDRNTPNPFGGEISKDKTGEPNGMLLDHAQGLVRSRVPREAAADPEKEAIAADQRSLMLVTALKQGIQVETHAIGDRANRFVLDEYERAFKSVPAAERKIAGPRWRDEHSQIVNPADLPRFSKLGVIPSMQPSHAIGDLFFASRRLGMERLQGAYAWQTLIKSGALVAGGSDAPVERGEPMIEFYAAVARKPLPSRAQGASLEGWHPEEAMTREQALKSFTLWAAYAAFEEDLKGSIAVGKLADFTVLSADIMKIPEPEILKTRNLMTIIGGRVVYESPSH